ncbi:hypothetical protein HP062_16495 [Pseudomonas sp. B14-6]|nr:hypothetical protein HP062_16495 [Pseudomonas sp. B14-6]
MGIKLKQSNLQEHKYAYTWARDDGDGKYTGPLDRAKVDKDEGYEVMEFIENLMNAYGKKFVSEVHAAEDALHVPSLSRVVSRAELNLAVKTALGW